jgi:shikimate kinase
VNIRLKRTPGIYVVGFMGAGKTTVGRLLAERIGWSFVDVDDDIEASAGMPITGIFDTRGEAEFRRIETEAIRARVRSIESGHPTVMAVGGGAFVQEANFEMLSGNGVSIWLDCPLEVLERRCREFTHRPLARDPERFARLLEERRPGYARADYRVAIDGDDPEAAVDAVLRLPLFQ